MANNSGGRSAEVESGRDGLHSPRWRGGLKPGSSQRVAAVGRLATTDLLLCESNFFSSQTAVQSADYRIPC